MAHLSLRLKGLGFRVRGVGPWDLDLGVQGFGVRLVQPQKGIPNLGNYQVITSSQKNKITKRRSHINYRTPAPPHPPSQKKKKKATK